ncbi:MAG: coproporphyrinogen dehydrogenase HemZ [Clostridia bacterium]|nr:coproporphyrinogen dehydrogenase HemZ [Clostridia bacterium]
MKLILDGKINRTYVQSLCMMFFHGEKFPENEENPKGIVRVSLLEKENGIEAKCKFSYCGSIAFGSAFVDFNNNEAKERTSKSAVGRAVYFAGKELTGKDIPWGILTGIRPSKVGAELLERYSYEEALKILIERYLLTKEKATLTLDVAKNETEILKKYNENTCSLYISIPFCPTRCSYCSFISYATKKLFDLIPEYLKKLKKDINEKIDLINELGLNLVSVYIGGGTPTTLNEEQLTDLLDALSSVIDVSSIDEFTVECGRPDTVTKGKLEILKKYGVTRISINPQTLNDCVLEHIGRKHTVNDFFLAYDMAKCSQVGLINTDLIAGLDGDNFDSFKNTVDKIIELEPENVTVHSFSVKKSARILEDDADIYNKNGDYATKSVDYAYKSLTENGYLPYYMYRQKNTVSDLENVGYARKDTFGIYNVLMMSDSHTVFSAGAGATTKLIKKTNGKININRIFSPKYPYEYLEENQDNAKRIIEFFNR